MKKRIVLLFSLIGLLLVTIVSTSFALFTKSKAQDGINQITTYNCLDISIDGENELNLTNAYPIKDEEGILQAPYLFTIKNNCDHYVGVDLGIEYQEESTINVSLVKATLNKPTEGIIPRVLSNYTKIQETDSETGLPIENAKYIMVHEGLPAGDEQTFEYRMWIDYSVENLSPSDKLKVKIVAIGTVQSEEAAPKNWYSSEENTLLAALRNNNSVRKTLTIPGSQISSKNESVLASASDDYGTSFYYRGNVQNNYLLFANKCWRIVRIMGDGSIKITLYNNNVTNITNPCSQTVANAAFSNTNHNFTPLSDTYPGAIGYMYGSKDSDNYDDIHSNDNYSRVFMNLKSWYSNNLLEYDANIADVIWCNDKSISSKGTKSTIFNATKRVGNNNLSLTCPNASGSVDNLSKFTANSENGNGKLLIDNVKYKIGLLTVDEVILAGARTSTTNNTYYLYANTQSGWWTLSPRDYDGAHSHMFVVMGTSYISYVQTNNHHSTRPTIALSSTSTILSGDGTVNNPYVINV